MSQLSDFGLGNRMKVKGKIQTVGVVGCGSVGQAITLLVSRYGMDVVFVDISKERIDDIFVNLGSQLDDEINHWGITSSEKRLVLSRIKGTTDYSDIKNCDIVIEATNSRKKGTLLEPRKEIFKKIEEVVSDDAIISSSISTLMISDLAEVLDKPERALGMNFISPVDKTNIVEVVKSINTSDEAYEKVRRFCSMIGKKDICVNESPGNISTRMIIPIINEACEILMEGVASVDDIDLTMKETLGHNVGPFELADKIGLDKVLKYMENLYAEYGSSKYKASPVIKRLVRVGYLGKYVGSGFYNYENGKPVSNTITCTILK